MPAPDAAAFQPAASGSLDTLSRCIRAITAASSGKAVWNAVVAAMQELYQPDQVLIYVLDPDHRTLVCKIPRPANNASRTLDISTPHARPIALALAQQSPISGQVAPAAESEETTPICLNDVQARSIAVIPITGHEEIDGALVVCHRVERPYTQSELAIGQSLVHAAGATLRGLNYQQRSEQLLLREQRLNEMTRQLNESLDMPTILLSVIKLAAELVEADAGLLGLLIDNEIMTFYPHNVPFHMSLRPAARGRGVAWHIVQHNQSVLLNDYMEHPQAQEKWKAIGISAFIGVPIATNKATLGALTVFALHPGKKFTTRDLALTQSIGRQAAVAIEHARMFAEAKQRATALANALNRQNELDQLKNQFIQTVSHELRSPLGIIFGHAELLASGDMGEMTSVQYESVNIILRRVRMLTDLVDDLTALLAAETQEFRRELIDPRLLVLSMLSDHKIQAAEKSIQLEAEIADSLPWLHGDMTQLRRVFDNLISNAFKFTPADGVVKICMEAENGSLVIDVVDSGEGIAPENLPRIFERFYQVTDAHNKPRKKGTGLGLALVKEIVEAHRGAVSVQSTPGEGATFHIVLPGVSPPEQNAVSREP